MALQFYSSPEEGLTTVTGDGTITWDCLLRTLQDLLASDVNAPQLPHLIDLSKADLELRSTTMEPFGEFFARQFGSTVTGSIALVVSDSLGTEDCAKFYRIASSVSHAELFDDYNHAMRWLMRREFAASAANSITNAQ